MKVSILVLAALFVISVESLEPKLCKNCKHFIQNPRDIKFSKCGLFTKLQEDNYVLIDNIVFEVPVEHYYCSVSRNYNYMCGRKAKKFEEK